MKKLIIANWKVNPSTYREAERLALEVSRFAKKNKRAEIVLCPPFVYVSSVKSHVSRTAKVGAQDCFWESKGPFTGEVSPAMLKNSGVDYVILGHSERRRWLGETDEMVNKKVLAALKAGLKVILCVGEPQRMAKGKEQRARGAKTYVRRQLEKNLRSVDNLPLALRSLLTIAYEPVWAISTSGTGKIDTPEDAAEMARFIKNLLVAKPYTLNPRILYGGSVNARDIKSYLDMEYIDGVLVGGASIKAEEFKKIVEIANKSNQHGNGTI
ncbi:MAG: triose-phosphate isomerase [Candidatus Liptonbacteria bacterium]|nr:triose-phosphate isomerase [Candidatus Liptonbacteria bacterium]